MNLHLRRVALGVLLAGPALAGDPRDAAVDRCLRAMGEEDAWRAGEVCADLYADEACRSAWAWAAALPVEGRVSSVFHACAHAACPDLPAPRPAGCALGPDAPPSALAAAWRPLREAILVRDLGRSRAARFLAAAALVEPLPPPPLPEVVAEPFPEITLTIDGGGALVARVAGRDVVLPPAPTAADLAPVLAELAPGPLVALNVDDAVPFGALQVVLAALAGGGWTDVQLTVAR